MNAQQYIFLSTRFGGRFSPDYSDGLGNTRKRLLSIHNQEGIWNVNNRQ
jgi:hypothetical protein